MPVPELDRASADSDGTINWLFLLVGLVAVAGHLLRGGAWGIEPTLGAIFCTLGARALLLTWMGRVHGGRKNSSNGRA